MIDFDGFVTIYELKNLPEAPGVYFVQNQDSEILYIGKSKNIKKRWYTNAHHKSSDILDCHASRISWVLVNESELSSFESCLIETYSPPLNWKRSPDVLINNVAHKLFGDPDFLKLTKKKLGKASFSFVAVELLRMWLNGEVEIKL